MTDGHEGWIFKREVNLIAGSSGTGKSTIALALLEQARQGLSVLNHPALRREYRVIMFDRSEEAFQRTADRMKLDEAARSRIYRPDQRQRWPLVRVINEYMNRIEGGRIAYPDVLFVEGLDMLVPGGEVNDFDTVSTFLEELAEVARFWDVAILGSVGSPKQRQSDRYLLARDGIFGSVAWGRKSETIMSVQLSDPENENSIRKLVVLPRNGPAEDFKLRFRYGRLEVMTELEGVEEVKRALASDDDYGKLVAAVKAMRPGTPIVTRLIPGLSQSGASRLLRRLHAQEPELVGKSGQGWTRI